jgi:hypothetical protein
MEDQLEDHRYDACDWLEMEDQLDGRFYTVNCRVRLRVQSVVSIVVLGAVAVALLVFFGAASTSLQRKLRPYRTILPYW